MDDISKLLPADQIRAFKRCAKECNVYLLLRETNPASLQYINHMDFHPKPISCKPKTADADVHMPGIERKVLCAGLVVNPAVPGMEKAFRSGKLEKALEAWKDDEFWEKLAPLSQEGRRNRTYTHAPCHKWYATQENPESRHYGCIMYNTTGIFPRKVHPKTMEFKLGIVRQGEDLARFYDPYLPDGCLYLHGDYDLYGVVDAEDPANNVILEGTLGHAGTIATQGSHTFGKKWWRVQHLLNDVLLQSSMIQHGSHEKFGEHQEDVVIVFYPDGNEHKVLQNKAAIEQFYRVDLGGRLTAKEKGRPVYDAYGRIYRA